METFDYGKLAKLVDNKFHLVLGIIERVRLLKRGVEAKVPRKGRDLIAVALEEFEKDLLSFEIRDIDTDTQVHRHSTDKDAIVAPEQAREEALAAQNAGLGFGTAIDRRPFAAPKAVPTPVPSNDLAADADVVPTAGGLEGKIEPSEA